MFSRKDFTYTCNADGYMIQYKGHNLGGAGVALPRSKPLHWRHARQNIIEFKEAAEREINSILHDCGQTRFTNIIERFKKEDIK
jgi:hypothetical protein